MSAIDDREAIENYFKFLKEVLDEHALLEKPAQIYNVDESSIPLDHPSSTSCCGERGQQKVCYCTSGNKNLVTVVGFINATGSAMPPLVIFDAESESRVDNG